MRDKTFPLRFSRLVGIIALSLIVSGIGTACDEVSAPDIVNVDVEPEEWSRAEITDQLEFKITADIINFDNPISRVTATIEETGREFSLSKIADTFAGERWEYRTPLSEVSDIPPGTYELSFVAVSAAGDSTTVRRGTSFTVID